jgi:hypothetical protein
MEAQAGWNCAPGPGAPIVVAVINSGIAQLHPDQMGRVHPKSRRIIGSLFDNVIEPGRTAPQVRAHLMASVDQFRFLHHRWAPES